MDESRVEVALAAVCRAVIECLRGRVGQGESKGIGDEKGKTHAGLELVEGGEPSLVLFDKDGKVMLELP